MLAVESATNGHHRDDARHSEMRLEEVSTSEAQFDFL